MNAALTAVGCGHDVPNGKVIDVDVTTQSAVFFDDGCIAGFVARDHRSPGAADPDRDVPHLREVLADHADLTLAEVVPLLLHARECRSTRWSSCGGGFFIHDAPWEPSSAFGPGSQNGVDASHGCVHIPTPTMAWLYAWSPIGTTVIIHATEAQAQPAHAWVETARRPVLARPGDPARPAGS